MKAASPALRSLLASRAFYAADLYTIVLAAPIPLPAIDNFRVADDDGLMTADDGGVRLIDTAQASGGGSVQKLCFTSGDRDILANGSVYSCGGVAGPFFERNSQSNSLCTWKRGLEVSTLSFDVDPGAAMVGTMPFLSACRNGLFDGAELTLERAYMPTYGDVSAGTVVMFVGRVAEIDAGRSFATFQIASHLELLNQQIPRNLYQASCSNSVFDSSCGLLKANYTVTGGAAAGSTRNTINTAVLGKPTGWFDLGVITFTSGANAGLSRSVKAYTSPSIITLINPFPAAPQAGDTFTVTPGCDKSMATCKAKFANLSRFRGAPFIPDPETAN